MPKQEQVLPTNTFLIIRILTHAEPIDNDKHDKSIKTSADTTFGI